MKILKAIGGVANGWLKFFVTLAAVGWFGFNALDRYTGPELDASTPTEYLVVSETSTTEGESQATYASLIGDMNLSEIKDEVAGFAKTPNATVLLGLFSAFGLGLASRPGLDWFNKKRRIRTAKKRAKQHEEDLYYIAMDRKQKKQLSV